MLIRRRTLGKIAAAGAATSIAAPAIAQNKPLTIGFSMNLTGPLAPNGKATLLASQIWESDINAKGLLLLGVVVFLLGPTRGILADGGAALGEFARRFVGTPLKWVEDRVEHLHAATHASDHRYELTAGFDGEGHLLGLRADITCNTGAYSVHPWTAGIEPLMAGGLLAGPYKVADLSTTTLTPSRLATSEIAR